jgi:hypothetical protein
MWTTAQLTQAGMMQGTVGMDAAPRMRTPVATDAVSSLTTTEMALLEDLFSSMRPRKQRVAVAQDTQLYDAVGRPVDHPFLTFDSQPIVTKPPVYKPVKALPKVQR